MSKRRQARIADVVQRELSDIIWRRIKDPRLEGLTITGTRISADYMYADIYFYRLGGDQEDLEEAREGLESASGFIRRELGGTNHSTSGGAVAGIARVELWNRRRFG